MNTRDNTIIFNQSTQFISAISQIKLYPSNNSTKTPKHIITDDNNTSNGTTDGRKQVQLDLLVVNAILPVVHFTNVTENALTDYKCLRRKDTTSVSTCSTPADIDFDGKYEIMIGNSLEVTNLLFSNIIHMAYSCLKTVLLYVKGSYAV